MFDVIMKKNKEWLRLYRMPGSKPGIIPLERRDFGLYGRGPWGNPKDFLPIMESLKVQGLALVDEIDSPGEIIYLEAETLISKDEQSNSEVN